MKIKVIYVGTDSKYWNKLQSRFLQDYQEYEFEFLDIVSTAEANPLAIFKSIYTEMPQIVYLDFSLERKKILRLGKWLCRNNQTRLISLVGLYDLSQGFDALISSVHATIRLNHIKSNEIHDVIYDPISLLDVDLAHTPKYIHSSELKGFTMCQPVRISYIQNDRFHIETNSYLKMEQIVELSNHPLSDIMPSCKMFVDKFYDRDLYYNRRFAYDLEFIYLNDGFFSATNEDWKLYKKLKNNPELADMLGLNRLKKEEILEEIEKRKQKSKRIIENIEKWMQFHSGDVEPKKLKVMIVDETLDALDALGQDAESFPYSLNFQTVLLNDYYQIQRTMPHLLMVRMEQVNNKSVIKEMITKIKNIAEYDPFVFIFKSDESSKAWQEEMEYPYIMATYNSISLELVKDLAHKLDSRINISEIGSKVFLNSSDPASNLYLRKEIEVVSMSESTIYIKSKVEIPMWTVFLIRNPVRMLVTVVPHREGSEYQQPNCYRCLINGVGEAEKAQIRRMINKSFEV